MAQALPAGKIAPNFFYNKTIWITGASSGIGEQLTYDLSKLGAKLILSARRRGELERVKNACEGYSNNISILTLDLADHDALPKKVEEVLKKVGKLDILINNGGISQREFALNTSFEVDKRIMDVNYFGTIAITKPIAQSMARHQLGQILTITSVAGKIGPPMRSAYSASKFALHGFMDVLRAEIAQYDVTVTTVCPGFVKTKIAENALTGNGLKRQEKDPNIESGMEVSYVSSRILNALRKKREEVYIGKKEVLGVYIMRLWPKLLFKWMKKLAKTGVK